MSDGAAEHGEQYGDRSIPVQRIRPGDHAFAAYDTEPGQWDVISAFVRQGLIEGEKVLVFLPPEVTGQHMLGRLEARTPALVRAWENGQLVLSSMRALIHPDRDFTAERQWQRLIEEADLALGEGYPATRAYIDMAWVADLGTDVADVMWRECSADHLFEDRRYSEVCAYDERWFSDDVLERMLRAHPRTLLDTVGSLRSVSGTRQGAPALRLIGEADVSTGEDFGHAVRTALKAGARQSLTVDLTALHFLGVGCAADLLRISAEAGTGVTVNCTPFQASTLRRLGSDSIRTLTLTVEEVGGC
ncbi:MEDS domain-containing protein [Streptomyces sp. ODS28]|uniref:MEDS domain-containing protein n=1 Tax=Streptomyces sp. ODS28 TaxID=3136688 RepID=UPI0031EF71A4